MKDRRQKERGQVLVLIILAIVGMMGFAAMAVDLGRLYSERRRAQSAADAAAMAWAYHYSQAAPSDPNPADPAVAENSLAMNDFPTDPSVVDLNYPPASGPYAGNDEYFQVILHGEVGKIFGQFIFLGPLNFQVEAVSHAIDSQPISPGNALVAMSETACPGIVFNGGQITTIYNGSVYSNSNGNGPGNCYSGFMSGAPSTVNAVDGEINIAAQWRDSSGHGIVSPEPNENVGHTDFPDVDPPVCPTTDAGVMTYDNHTKIGTMTAGVYDSPVNITTGDWTMGPGMYCFHADFHFSGGKMEGHDILIVMYSGTLTLNGSSTTDLTRANTIYDANHDNFGGFLVFMPYDNPGGIDIAGGSGTEYSGTIYAPGPRIPESQEKCNLGGANETMAMNSAVMCSTIGVAGNATLTINYQEDSNYRDKPRVELAQ